jgi:hypothetical protein
MIPSLEIPKNNSLAFPVPSFTILTLPLQILEFEKLYTTLQILELDNLIRQAVAHKDAGTLLQMEDLRRWI